MKINFYSADVLKNGLFLPDAFDSLTRLAVHEACVNAAKYGGGKIFSLAFRQTRTGVVCAVSQQKPVVWNFSGPPRKGISLIEKICCRRMILNNRKTLAFFIKTKGE